MDKKQRTAILLVICGWLILALSANLVQVPEGYNWIWLVLQQTLLIVGGLTGSGGKGEWLQDKKDVSKGLLGGIGIFCLNLLTGFIITQMLFGFFGEETAANWIVQERRGVDQLLSMVANGHLWLVGVLVVIGAPLSEELFFRGLLLEALSNHVGDTYAVLLSALIFALVHFYLIQFIPVLLSGILLGRLYLKSRGITRPLIAHMVVNGIVLLLSI